MLIEPTEEARNVQQQKEEIVRLESENKEMKQYLEAMKEALQMLQRQFQSTEEENKYHRTFVLSLFFFNCTRKLRSMVGVPDEEQNGQSQAGTAENTTCSIFTFFPLHSYCIL